jgi:asparagine synthase (glutamine-hydrolysing)
VLGDFVAVVLDRGQHALLVARDPVGVRPWYQATAGSRHAGASDVATLASLDWVDTAVNEHIAIEYLAAHEESRGETLHRGITTLRPGRTWRRAGGAADTLEHHQWRLEPDLGISWDDAAERCRSVVQEAVACRLRGVDRPTSELSGGLDSSTVVGTAVGLGHDDLLVGRLVFDGPRADERAYSDAVIHHWGLEAVSVPPWIATEGDHERLTRDLRRPVPDPHFTMFTALHDALRARGSRESLTGLGGDDAFIDLGVGPRVVSAVQLRQGAALRALARSAMADRRHAVGTLLRPTLGHLVKPWRRARLPGGSPLAPQPTPTWGGSCVGDPGG